jgi:CheY-like chemotaxis protein
MEHKILIVDDDEDFLADLVSQFETSQNIFDMVTATDGAEALNILKTTSISLVVSDVQMPVMDGFILMAYTSGLYPDIPVIMMNDPGEVGAEEAALESGAVAYMEKPFTPKELLLTISDTFKKMSDGGQLSNVSLEMFIQLFEMEQKNCTVRVLDKDTDQSGVLFFKDGEIVNARLNEIEGNEAAYEIISWENISVSISDTCIIEDSLIDSDNQAIMLEAARRKEDKAGIPGGVSGEKEIDERTQIKEALDPEATDAVTRGGKLSNVSLEMFVQLFEMEEKTCALTVENPKKNKKGVLYFKDGELLDAKLNYITGNKAALEILSWERVSIEIGYDMDVTEKQIDGDLQGMLLEAMRLRDEGSMSDEDFLEEGLADTLAEDFSRASRTGDKEASVEGAKKAAKPGGFRKFWSRLTKK